MSSAFTLLNSQKAPATLFVCDHASKALPPEYGTLGLSPEVFQRHIAFDVGAAYVTKALANAFNAPAILGSYSRLLIDLNRGADDPTLVMKLSDGEIIPGNARIDEQEIQHRVEKFYRPYHDAIEQLIAGACTAHVTPVIVSIHSFTPEWKGTKRPWQIGILWSRHDDRLAAIVLKLLRQETDLCVGDNQPYSGELEGDCMAQHALAHGLPHVLIELRQDLISTPENAHHWSARLAPILRRAIDRLDSSSRKV